MLRNTELEHTRSGESDDPEDEDLQQEQEDDDVENTV